MSNNEHMVAIIDRMFDAEAGLQPARETIQRGGKATLVLLLTTEDRRRIAALADGARLSIGEAEEIYVNRIKDEYLEGIGDSRTRVIVRNRPSGARDLLATAQWMRATSMSLPTSLVGHRKWRSALTGTPMRVFVTPVTRAA